MEQFRYKDLEHGTANAERGIRITEQDPASKVEKPMPLTARGATVRVAFVRDGVTIATRVATISTTIPNRAFVVFDAGLWALLTFGHYQMTWQLTLTGGEQRRRGPFEQRILPSSFEAVSSGTGGGPGADAIWCAIH